MLSTKQEADDEMAHIFFPPIPFDTDHVARVPRDSGVYIIWASGKEMLYVGRSRVNIRARLRAHLLDRGSKAVAKALRAGEDLTFEYEEMISVEQFEAWLIDIQKFAPGTAKKTYR